LAWPRRQLTADDIPVLRSNFEALYEQRYGAGTFRRETPLEIISFRAEAVKPTEKPNFAPLFEGRRGSSAPKRQRQVFMRGCGQIDASVYAYDDLAAGAPLNGPAIIERESTTVWLPSGACATLDIYGNLAIDLET
jgi:N-methylhydantoinase A/oxoprolinase/acetone carboxylase beta subunit